MNQLPIWVQFVQALGTPIVALLVGFVAFRQWRTAREKLVMDLFDKRFGAYLELRELVSYVATKGHLPPNKDVNLVVTQARFLFPKEIADEVREIQIKCTNTAAGIQVPAPDALTQFTQLGDKLEAYMAMTQRL